MPRGDDFFLLLQESSANLKVVAACLLDLMENYENVSLKVNEIKRMEEVGDEIIHRIMTKLHESFITPLDREDIASLGERLDDVVDCIEEAARYMVEYRIEAPTENAKELSRILVRCADIIDEAMGLLRKRSSKPSSMFLLKDTLNTLENQADKVTSKAMAELFESYSTVDIIKWKEVYEQLEGATDRCEDIAAILEGIVIKNG
jgi:hypothetical protein